VGWGLANLLVFEEASLINVVFEWVTEGILVVDSETKRFIFANQRMSELTGYPLEGLTKLGLGEIHPKKDLPWVLDKFNRLQQGEIDVAFDIPVTKKDGQVIYFDVNAKPATIKNQMVLVGFFRDVTERKKAYFEQETSAEFLKIVNRSNGTLDLIQNAIDFFQRKSDFEAVGIRLKKGEDYPYFETKGFPQGHVLLENELCVRDFEGNLVRDSVGNPVIECMCGNIIMGRFDSSKPFFTEEGSFWTNSTTELLGSSSEADRQARTRNRCNGEGYESVALFPLRVGTERLGLIQLNDKRKNMFKKETIELLERLASYLAIALSKTVAEDKIIDAFGATKQSKEKLKLITEKMRVVGGLTRHDVANKLAVIRTSVYLLRKQIGTHPNVDRYFESIESAIIASDKLFEFSRLYEKIGAEQIAIIDVEKCFNQAVAIMPNLVMIEIVNKCQGLEVLADSLLRQLFYNLIDNSLKHGEKVTQIRLYYVKVQDKVKLFYEDDGVGIPDSSKSKIFDDGFTTGKGSGLGLSLVNKLCEVYGWKVTEEGHAGKGVKFVISIKSV
jgi:PAS domain S-box-containing protein